MAQPWAYLAMVKPFTLESRKGNYQSLSYGVLGVGAPFFAPCQKWRPFRPQFWKNNFWEHLLS